MLEQAAETNEFNWCESIRQITQEHERLRESAYECELWIAQNVAVSDVLPNAIPEPLASHLAALHDGAARIGQLASELFEQLCSEPTNRFLRQLTLTHTQYYLIRASGVSAGSAHSLGLSPLEDFNLFELLRYQDDRWAGYIDTSKQVRDTSSSNVGVSFGRAPEELSRSALRPEQVAFFEKHLPSVLARFRD